MDLKLKLLEYNSGVIGAENTPWANILGRYNGRVMKFKVDVKKSGDLSAFLDKEVTAKCEVIVGKELSATLKIVGVEKA